MDEQEQTVINLIVNAGSARSSAIEAIQYAKAGDIEKAENARIQNGTVYARGGKRHREA